MFTVLYMLKSLFHGNDFTLYIRNVFTFLLFCTKTTNFQSFIKGRECYVFPFFIFVFLKLDCIISIRLSTVATTTIFFSFNLSVAFVQVRIDYVNCREATVLVRPTPAEAHLLDIQIDQVRLNKEVEAPKIKISLN